jgi:hypothetical protein
VRSRGEKRVVPWDSVSRFDDGKAFNLELGGDGLTPYPLLTPDGVLLAAAGVAAFIFTRPRQNS